MKLRTGWWCQTFGLFFHSVGKVIIPTDEVHHFSEGLFYHQPDTNQLLLFDDQNPVLIGATPILVGISVSLMVNKKSDLPHRFPPRLLRQPGRRFRGRCFTGVLEGRAKEKGKLWENMMGTSIKEGFPIAMFDCWRVLKNFMGDHVFSSFFSTSILDHCGACSL